jgi:hypothetical protein
MSFESHKNSNIHRAVNESILRVKEEEEENKYNVHYLEFSIPHWTWYLFIYFRYKSLLANQLTLH